jgi:hypothetical protein
MPDTTKKPTVLVDDAHAAIAAEALALRCLSRYRAARESAGHYGGDLSQLPDTASYAEIATRYTELMHTVTQEPPDTTSSELAYLELIESIIADAISPHEGPVMGPDEDLCCALQILHWSQRRANERDIDAEISAERAKRAAVAGGVND